MVLLTGTTTSLPVGTAALLASGGDVGCEADVGVGARREFRFEGGAGVERGGEARPWCCDEAREPLRECGFEAVPAGGGDE